MRKEFDIEFVGTRNVVVTARLLDEESPIAGESRSARSCTTAATAPPSCGVICRSPKR